MNKHLKKKRNNFHLDQVCGNYENLHELFSAIFTFYCSCILSISFYLYIISGSQSGIPDSGLKTVQNWLKPETSSKFGQLSSVAFDVYGNVVVFHRGDRTWNGFTFDR